MPPRPIYNRPTKTYLSDKHILVLMNIQAHSALPNGAVGKGILFGCPSNIIVPFYFNDVNKTMPVVDFQHTGHLLLNIPSYTNHLQQEHLKLPLYWYDPIVLYEMMIEPAYQYNRYNYGSDLQVHSYYVQDTICHTKDISSPPHPPSWITNIMEEKEEVVMEKDQLLFSVRKQYPYLALKNHLFFLFTHIFNLPHIHQLMDISQFSIGVFPLATHQGSMHLWGYVLIYKETILPTAMFYSPLLYSFKDMLMEYRYNIQTMEREIQLHNNSIYVDKLKIETLDNDIPYYDTSYRAFLFSQYREKTQQNRKTKRFPASCSYIWYDDHQRIIHNKQHLMPVCFMIVAEDTIFPANLIMRHSQLSHISSTHLHYMMAGSYIGKPIYELYQ